MNSYVCKWTLVLAFFAGITLFAQEGAYIMTVNGKLPIEAMGKTLIHEHIITDFAGTKQGNHPIENQERAVQLILPYLLHLKTLGFQTLFECTPSHIGKNVGLLKELSKRSGLHIVTNTGYYAAVNKKYVPDHAYTESAETLAKRWLAEWEQGISDSGIRPGFIKLGVGKGPLDSLEKKIVKAGFQTSKASGMALAIHTGDGSSSKSQYDWAIANDFDVNRLIWVHAQNGTDEERIEMAKNGVWISLDGVSETKLDRYVSMLVSLKQRGLLHRVLLSHDDGWSITHSQNKFNLELFKNGNTKPYRTISEQLVARLLSVGFTQEEINRILIGNPKQIMAIHQ